MRNIEWLDKFVSEQTEKKQSMKKTASQKNKVTGSLDKYDMIILSKDMLPNAVNGNKVKYNNLLWKVVNASYKDAVSNGVVLQKVAGISTKPLTSPEERAYTDPGNVYDYNVRETSEVPDFEAAANATAEQIARENAVDHSTTPEAKYQNPVLMDNAVPAVEPVVVDETVVETEPVIENEVVVQEDNAEVPNVVEEEFTLDDVDAEPVEIEDSVEDKTDEPVVVEDEIVNTDEDDEKKDEVKASTTHKNRIIAAMLASK